MFETIVREKHFLEAPRWRQGRLWFSDFYGGKVYSVAEDGSDERVEAEIDGQPGGIGWLPGGDLLVVSMVNKQIMRVGRSGDVSVHADLSEFASGNANDMVVDARGYCYVGNFGFDLMGGGDVRSANLIGVTPEREVFLAAEDLWFPNGSVITPAGDLLVAETFGNRVTKFAIDDDGRLSNREVWANFGPLPPQANVGEAIGHLIVAGDGTCLDIEGGLWVADAIGNRLVRVMQGAGIVEELVLDVPVFACALGGSDGRTLFLCAAPDFHAEARSLAREGSILSCRVTVPGVQ
jgi:sugar lactone lactonase YvrE